MTTKPRLLITLDARRSSGRVDVPSFNACRSWLSDGAGHRERQAIEKCLVNICPDLNFADIGWSLAGELPRELKADQLQSRLDKLSSAEQKATAEGQKRRAATATAAPVVEYPSGSDAAFAQRRADTDRRNRIEQERRRMVDAEKARLAHEITTTKERA